MFTPKPTTPPPAPEVDVEEVNRRAAEAEEEKEIDWVPETVSEDFEPRPEPDVNSALVEALTQAESDREALASYVQEREQYIAGLTDDLNRVSELNLKSFTREQELAAEVERLSLELEEKSKFTFTPILADNPITPIVEDTWVPLATEPLAEPERPIAPEPEKVVVTPQPTRTPNSDFGTAFPNNPERGDMFLRTDFKPSRLFKWNDKQWIEVNKNVTDVFNYNDAYIQFLAEKLSTGEYGIDDLTDLEYQQVQRAIGR
jgi:hypothetical protein